MDDAELICFDIARTTMINDSLVFETFRRTIAEH